MIALLKHTGIDAVAWNDCISSCSYSNSSHRFEYLMAVANNFHAIVFSSKLGQYDAVLPFDVSNKLGLKYAHQIASLQQSGILTTNNATIDAQAMWDFLFSKFTWVHIKINAHYVPKNILNIAIKDNYILALNQTYNEISSKYKSNHKKKINQSKNLPWQFIDDLPQENFINLLNEEQNFKKLKPFYKPLHSLCLSHEPELQYVGITLENTLQAALMLGVNKNSVIVILNLNSKSGMNNNAMFILIDYIIEKFSNNNLILDFEGSMIPGIAQFYRGFGAEKQVYYELKYGSKFMTTLFHLNQKWKNYFS